jgi:hypothetical protein
MGDPVKGLFKIIFPLLSVRLMYHRWPARFQTVVSKYDFPSKVTNDENGGIADADGVNGIFAIRSPVCIC